MSKKPVRKILPKHKDMQARLRSHWDQAKAQQPDKIKQTSAAEFMNIRQASVSGYLGGSVALNKEIILQFINFFKHCGYTVQPEDIDPELGDLLKYSPKIFVLSTVDRKRPDVEYVVLTDHTGQTINMYGIQTNKNTVAVITPEASAHKNSKVCVTTNTDYRVGKLIDKNEDVVVVRDSDHEYEIPSKKVVSIHKVVTTVPI